MNRKIVKIAKRIEEIGGRMFVVGGAVRDKIRHVTPKDFDFMVSGVWQEDVVRIITEFGGEIAVADAISNAPVFIATIGGEDFEIAMARIEVDNAPGKHGFRFVSNPEISPLVDAKRRDFTIGAIYQDVVSGAIFDPFNGVSDVKAGIIRHVDTETFVQSPERVFRAAAQSARFGFRVHNETLRLCRIMRRDFHTIPREQIWRHIEKAGTNPVKASNFLDVLIVASWDKFFPIHTTQAARAMFALDRQDTVTVEQFVAALIAGMSFTEEETFFEMICCPKSVARKAVEIKQFGNGGKPGAWVQGRDIMDVVEPGVEMGKAVRWGYIGQINDIFNDKDEVINWIKENFK